MGYRCSRLRYTLAVEGIFLDRTRFVIHAVVAYSPGLTAVERHRAAAEAQVELLFAIVGESDRGRTQGARSIHVAVDGDDRLAGFFKLRSDEIPPSWAA